MRWFEQMGFVGKMLVVCVLVLFMFAGLHLYYWIRFSRPQRYRFEGRIYFFRPDPLPGFRLHRYKYGHFVEEDGAPIADEALAARIMRRWSDRDSGDAGSGSW